MSEHEWDDDYCKKCGRHAGTDAADLPCPEQYVDDRTEDEREVDPLGVGETLVDRHGNEYYGTGHDLWAEYISPDTAMEDLGND